MVFYSPAGPQFRVNGQRADDQYLSSSAALEDGGFVLVWTTFAGGTPAIKAQRYDAAGVPVGQELLMASSGAAGLTNAAAVSGLAGGGFVIARETADTSKDGSGSAIVAQIYDSAGQPVGSEFLVNSEAAGNQSAAVAIGFADGSFLVSWTTSQPAPGGTLSEVKARLFDSGGAPLGAEFLVNTTTAGAQSASSLAASPAGGFVAAWTSSNEVYAQRFDAAGNKVGAEFLVNTTTAGSQYSANVTVLTDGRFVVVWLNTAVGGFGQTVNGQMFDASGAAIGGEFVVTDPGAPPQTSTPQVKALPDGGFVATWTHSGTDVMGSWARLYDSSGLPSAAFMVNSAATLFESNARTLVTAGGDIVVAWTSNFDFQDMDVSARVIARNQAPVIQSDGGGAAAAFAVAGGQTVVTQVVAADRIGPAPVSYAIAGGADAALFSIDSATGHLTFVAAPDVAAPADADLDNVYEVVVSASDGELSDSQALSVTVAETGRGLIVASPSQTAVDENLLAVGKVSATDASATYAITGGTDASLFAIDSATGLLSFASAPNFEAPGDAGANNVYDVEVTATAGAQSAVQAIAVTVRNVNEGAPFTTPAAYVALENGLAAGTFAAVDAEGDPVTYYIVGGADADKFFLNSDTGVLTFRTAPNFEAPADAGLNGVYDVVVRVNDSEIGTVQAFAITVGNVNEGATISSNGGGATAAFSLAENQAVATTVVARDNPTGTAITYAISGGWDASRFTINAQTGVLSFVNVPNYEAPGDFGADRVYEVTVTASDGTVTDSQALAITITNVNEPFSITAYGGGDTGAVSSAENAHSATFAFTTDEQDAGTISIAIVGGEDAARFKVHSTYANTGWISFLTTPNFEAPTDANGDNVYYVTVQLSDGVHTDTQTLAVTVANVQENVVITSNNGGSSAFITKAENQASVTTVTATDPDNGTIAYSISGGADAARFNIDSVTGALTFISAPDYENPTDSGLNRVYDVVVLASDGVSSDTQAIAVTVSNVIEAFAITSHGGGDTGSVPVLEGFGTFAVTTNESANLSFSLSGADAARFTIVAGTGGNRTINFITQPNFEAPTDANGDNVYDVTVTVTGGGYSDSQTLAVTVGNVNEAPVITSNGGGATAVTSSPENGTAVTTVTATDPENGALTYSISGGADAAKFVIDSTTGALAFAAAPDYEAPGDVGANGVYDVVVRVSDGVNSDTQSIAVTVTNVQEGGPVITSNGGGDIASVSVVENSSAVTTVAATATPPMNGPVSYSISGGADAAKFMIDAATGALAFVATPNFEVRTDVGANGVYDVIVRASDGVNADTQAIAVTVTNVNEAPVITSGGGGDTASLNVFENSGTATTVTSTDPENTARSYAIIGGVDSARFTINATTGVLSFVTAPNFEAPGDAGANNVYDIVVRASDGVNSDTQAIAISILNTNEAPVISSNGAGASASVSVAENSSAVTAVAASDPENSAVTYSISGGADASKFTINATTGALAFVTAPNFETRTDVGANGVYDVIVRASDGASADTQAIAVTVTNVNEAPVITSNGGGATASVNLNENYATVTLVSSTDPEGTARTYSISGGADAARFTINATTGTLSFVAAADYENPSDAGGNNVYDVIVRASDGSLSDTQAIAITIFNLNEAPVITSNGGGTAAGVTVVENGDLVTTVVATDPENAARTYSISGGLDAAKFAIDPVTGVLSFVTPPDFESPTDSNGDNLYYVVVRASDGSFSDTQTLSVTVVDQDESIDIISDGGEAWAGIGIDENSLEVTQVQATSAAGSVTYSIVGGADAAFFTIDPATGLLSFVDAPDFEAPADSGGDNEYEVTVAADNGYFSDLQDISVSINDLFESQGSAPAGDPGGEGVGRYPHFIVADWAVA